MLPQNKPDRIQITFDDRRLVANAGLLLPATLARHLGLPELVQQHLDLGDAPGRANAGDKMMTLVASALAGGDFCVEALEDALGKAKPEIFNTDQGSQFTSEAFTGILLEQGIQISMDGKGRYTDNIFVERLWRSIKYEEVYLKAYQHGTERLTRKGIGAYLDFYNRERPHQALDYRTPGEVFLSEKNGWLY